MSGEQGRRLGRGDRWLLAGVALVATALAVVAAAVLVAKQRAQEKAGAGAVPAKAAAQAGQGAQRARLAKGFGLRTIDGKNFSLAAARGKVVVVDFLAPGCPTCAVDLAGLSVAAKRFAPGGVKVVIVDVSGYNDSKALRDYYRGDTTSRRRS